MKLKKEYIVLVLIIIALSAYLYMRSADRTLYQLPQIPPINEKDLTKLEITSGKATIVLNKKDDKWYIEPSEYSTDANKVKGMLEAIKNLSLTALVSESKDYNRYELEEGQKINVKAYQGDNLKLDIDVGKTASSFRHTFVRPSGDERVFHARGNLKNAFDVTVDMLRDKTVLSLKPAEIQQLNIIKATRRTRGRHRAAPWPGGSRPSRARRPRAPRARTRTGRRAGSDRGAPRPVPPGRGIGKQRVVCFPLSWPFPLKQDSLIC